MRTVQLEGTTLHVEDEGDGPAVLLLHAFPLHSGMWAPQIAALRASHRVIAPDLRGFGRSPDVPEALSMNLVAEDLTELLDTLGLGQVVVVGLSMGGYAALELHRHHRELFAGLVLADTRAGADTAEGRAGRETFAQSAIHRGMGWVADQMVPLLLAEPRRPAVEDEVRRVIAQNRPEAIAAAQRGMAIRADSHGSLRDIECPTLVIVGRGDVLTPPAEAEEMARGIRGSRLVVLENAGHLSNLEAVDDFNRELARFLDEVRRASPEGSDAR